MESHSVRDLGVERVKTQPPGGLFPFFMYCLKPYAAPALIFTGFALLAGCWGPFNSMLLKQILNRLPSVQGGDISQLVWPAALLVINFIVFDNLTFRGIDYLHYRFQARMKNKLIEAIFAAVLDRPQQFFQEGLSGRISNQITRLADHTELILHKISVDFLRGSSLLLISFLTAYFVNPVFFITLLVWFFAFATFSLMMSRKLVTLADAHADAESLLSGQLVDCITNHSNIWLFARKAFELFRMGDFFSRTQRAFERKAIFLFLLYSGQGALIASLIGCVIYFLVQLYGKGDLSIGDFALMLGLSMELGHMMWYTMSRVDDFNQSLGVCKQSLNGLMAHPTREDAPGAVVLEVPKGEIVFDRVKFHYKGAPPLFQNQSVVLEAGQKIGLVGHSGGGKTTFVNLILRFFDVTEGTIRIDGQDIQAVTQDSLREKIAIIPQEPLLFHRSLLENIRYGKLEATDEAVMEAAVKAHAHGFITQLPQGYAALVGERGLKLSGGQRQRIAIARAILKDAPILILDEATSQLDSMTETLIQESLWTLMQSKTTLVVAHRLSTLLRMDRILVFHKGEIVEDGTHEVLLNRGGLYRDLWEAQVGGFLQDREEKEGEG